MAIIAKYKPRLEGKKVMLYVGGLRPRHVVDAYHDLGMEVIGTGYEFGHNDDYQRTTHYIKEGTLIYDDVTATSSRSSSRSWSPIWSAPGIKEKYVFQKMGMPFRQMHSWDYSGPYHGYDGFAIFARDMDMAINNPVWNLTKAPWADINRDAALSRAPSRTPPPAGNAGRNFLEITCLRMPRKSSTTFSCSASRNTRKSSRASGRMFEFGHADEEVARVAEWTKTEEYKEKNFSREALTINPAKACQPLGAVFAAAGLREDAALRPRFTGLRRLLPLAPDRVTSRSRTPRSPRR